MLQRRVDLPSGGYLMIDYAEAMTVIDVNSGSFTGRGQGARLEDTITKTNLEAAEEVVRQLRLRDIGGIIVIDFIDMSRARNRDAVLKTLRKALDEDRTKTYVVEISPLGLVEMTRQNVTDGVREILTKPCPTCDGEGVVLSEETVAIEVERRLRDLVAEKPEARGLPDPGAPAGRRDPARRPGVPGRCWRSRPRPASTSTSRAPRRCRSTTSRWSLEGSPRGGRGARAAVPRGRGAAGEDRGAAHVQRGRRGRQDRRLRDLGRRRGAARRRAAAGADREGRAHLGRRGVVGDAGDADDEQRPTPRRAENGEPRRGGAGAAAAGAARRPGGRREPRIG